MLIFGLAASLVGAWWRTWSLALTPVLMLSLLVLNAPFYRFLQRKHGLCFALQAIPWHWFYYFYSGLGFAIGLARHLSHMTGVRRLRLLADSEKFSDREGGPEFR